MAHPSYEAGETPVPFPVGKPRRVTTDDGRFRFAPDDDYKDPVAEPHAELAAEPHPELAGRWIAGFAPVEGTELVVLVQQRYDDVVASQRSFVLRILAWLGGLAASGMLVFVSVLFAWSRRLKTARRRES